MIPEGNPTKFSTKEHLDPAAQARLRSQSGAHAGDHITALPTCAYTVVNPMRMNGMLRRRARLPLATGSRHCRALRCQQTGASLLDSFGDHGAACTRTGELKRRGSAVERAWRPLWEEAPVQASEHPLSARFFSPFYFRFFLFLNFLACLVRERNGAG